MAATEPDNTGRNQDGTFAKGVSGNPAGKPKGARHKLSENFFKDLEAAWQSSGKVALEEMLAERPHEFAKMVAGLQTKEQDVKVTPELSEKAKKWLNR